ncbi:MAG: hydrolase [Anaerovoracaceae bacterium]
MSIKMLKKEESVLVMIDVQERLWPAMNEEERDSLLERNEILIKGCRCMDVPILVTQQYTKGLGGTVEPLCKALGEHSHIEKDTFSAMRDANFVKELESLGRKTVILTGIESHVCVMLTALEMLQAGYDVFLPMDCVSSRKPMDKKFASKRMAGAGVQLTTSESVLFELCVGSTEPYFRDISKLVK